TNWRMVLKSFIKSTSGSHYDWGKPSKRGLGGGYYTPKVTKPISTMEPVVVAIDTSGSMSDKQVNAIMAELISILSTFKTKMRVLLWTDEVYEEKQVDSNTMRIDQIKKILSTFNMQGGGTELSCIKQYLDKQNVKQVNGLIVFTDGWVENNPAIPNAKKKMFLLVEGSAGTSDEVVKKFGPVHQIEIE
ncbi:MAG: VWA domain-containing protein, partial [Proteobacteria bacterium]|nr:VWA domain-containing protein [Pseudomonadota bacterium]